MGDDRRASDTDGSTRRNVDDGAHPTALSQAVRSKNWPLVADVIEADWPRLFMKHPDALRQAYAATPPIAFHGHPAARAVREMLFPVAPALPGRPLAELPDDQDMLTDLASGPDVVDVLRSGLACLVAMRLREEWTRAHEQAARLTTVLDLAQRHRFDEVSARIPGTELQVGITCLLAGDPTGALRHCTRAYKNVDLDRIGHVGRDAAAKVALVHAVRGDADAAERWMLASDAEPVGGTAMDAPIESSRLSARALIAVARLDRGEARRIQAEMHHGLIEEELWAIRLHALARVGLLLGDVIGTRRLLDDSNAHLPYARRPSPPIRDLLLADSVDLSMASGEGSRAGAILSSSEWALPVVDMCQARLLLLSGTPDAALSYATRALAAPVVSSRVEVEALVLSAVAHDQLGQRREATTSLRSAVTRATSSGSITGFAMVPGERLSTLADEAGHGLPSADLAELLPAHLTVIDLTPRERAVLQHLADGRYLGEIAAAEFVSINTVKTQARSIYRKLGAKGRDDAIRLAEQAGIL